MPESAAATAVQYCSQSGTVSSEITVTVIRAVMDHSQMLHTAVLEFCINGTTLLAMNFVKKVIFKRYSFVTIEL